jgi:hypothetical protein
VAVTDRRYRSETLANRTELRYNQMAMDLLNEKFLWASVIWGAIASGYLIYGWRQKDATCLAGGGLMTVVACFVPALPMSLICLATMAIVYWLKKQGY